MATLRFAVKSAVDAVDPEGLLARGAPANEYDPEVNDFAEQLSRGAPLTVDAVTATWLRWFGHTGSAAHRPLVMARLAGALAEALALFRNCGH